MTPDDYAILRALDARQIVGITIDLEARGEPIEGKIGVGCVLRNRVRTRYRGDSYLAVCLAPKQFSAWNDGDPNQARGLAIARKLLGGEQLEEVTRECLYVALGIVTDQIRDRVGASRHYHALSVRPAWAETHPGSFPIAVATLGRHRFYVGVA